MNSIYLYYMSCDVVFIFWIASCYIASVPTTM